MNIFIVVLSLLLAAVLLFFMLVYFLLFRPNFMRLRSVQTIQTDFQPLMKYNPSIQAGGDWFVSQNPEDVSIKSFDGLLLYGQFLAAKTGERNAKGTVIMMHGFHGFGLRDYAAFTKFYYDQDFNILLPDQRAHGKSQGKYITFGVKERFDCRDWILYVNKRIGGEKNIFLHGNSMGCSTVLMTSGFDLPANVKGIIADCGFTSPYEIIKHVLVHDFHLPVFPILPAAEIIIKCFAGFSMKEYSTLDAMKTNRIPVLFIHGENDDFVPTYMSRQNYDACIAEKRINIEPKAMHSESYYINTAKYKALVIDFIGRNS